MSKELNCITGKEKPEAVQSENGLVYLEKSRRSGYARAIEKLTEGTSDLNESELKELERKQMKHHKICLNWYKSYLDNYKNLLRMKENERKKMEGINHTLNIYQKKARYTTSDSIDRFKNTIGLRDNDFAIEVKRITHYNDFSENKHILYLVAKLDRWFFLQLLKVVCSIEVALSVLPYLIELNDNTDLSEEDIFSRFMDSYKLQKDAE